MDASLLTNVLASGQSSAGCEADTVNALWVWSEKNKWPLFAFLLIIGFIITFMGHAFLKPILFLTGVLEVTFLIIFICYSTFAKHSD